MWKAKPADGHRHLSAGASCGDTAMEANVGKPKALAQGCFHECCFAVYRDSCGQNPASGVTGDGWLGEGLSLSIEVRLLLLLPYISAALAKCTGS